MFSIGSIYSISLFLCYFSYSYRQIGYVLLNPRLHLASNTPQDENNGLNQLAELIHKDYYQHNYQRITSTFTNLLPNQITQLYSKIPRYAFNIGIKAKLKKSTLGETSSILSHLITRYGSKVASDTFNTFLSDILFVKKNYDHGKYLFQRYIIEGRKLLPTVRTFNHLLEAARIAGYMDDILYYEDKMMDIYKIFPDAATFATMIRSSSSIPYILKTYERAKEAQIINPIIFRCMLESLGTAHLRQSSEDLYQKEENRVNDLKGNQPSLAEQILFIALQERQDHSSASLQMEDGFDIFQHPLTGDSFVASLIELEEFNNPFRQINSNPMKKAFNDGESTFLASLLDKPVLTGFDIICYLLYVGLPNDTSSSTVTSSTQLKKTFITTIQSLLQQGGGNVSILSWNRLVLTSKGYCILFAYLQRQLRYNFENLKDTWTTQDQYTYLLDQLFQSYRNNLLEKEKIKETEYIEYSTQNILLNGKIIDAMLRANGYSFNHVIDFWKNDLSKIIYRIYRSSSSSPSSSSPTTSSSASSNPSEKQGAEEIEGRQDGKKERFLDCILTGYATLMFLAGYHNQPEYALSITRTFNKLQPLLISASSSSSVGKSAIVKEKRQKKEGEDQRIEEQQRQNERYYDWCEEMWNQYYYGKKLFIKDYQKKYSNIYSPLINHLFSIGIENTIQLELKRIGSPPYPSTSSSSSTNSYAYPFFPKIMNPIGLSSNLREAMKVHGSTKESSVGRLKRSGKVQSNDVVPDSTPSDIDESIGNVPSILPTS